MQPELNIFSIMNSKNRDNNNGESFYLPDKDGNRFIKADDIINCRGLKNHLIIHLAETEDTPFECYLSLNDLYKNYYHPDLIRINRFELKGVITTGSKKP